VVADIPGLIEGASEGRGLGHQFLRHIERARVMCVMVDLASLDGVSPSEQEQVLMDELEAYDPDLVARPRVVVGTKADLVPILDEVGWDGPVVSAITGQGVRELVGKLASLVHEARTAEPDREGIVILRPIPDGARVDRLGDHEFRLVGRQVERIVALNDITSPEALNYIDHQMKRMGVGRLLARAGATDGDIVWVGGFSFEYEHEA
jgi:GTP-binding protein